MSDGVGAAASGPQDALARPHRKTWLESAARPSESRWHSLSGELHAQAQLDDVARTALKHYDLPGDTTLTLLNIV